MYNRYILQNDGTHRRNSIPDPARPHPRPRPPQQREQPCPPQQREQPCPPPPPPQRDSPPPKRRPCAAQQGGSALGFLKNLLPGDFDTGDLMIVLLLILMAGDCQEDQNWAWLTLALYLFL